MEKIPEIIQTLIWSCHFLSLELPLSEIDENQGRPTTQAFTSNTVYVDTGKFQTTNKIVFASQGFSGLGFMTFCK